MKEAARAIDAGLRRCGSPKRKAATEGYFPSKLENLGVATKDLRAVVRAAKKELRGEDPRRVLAIARAVVAQRTLEGRQAAYEILAAHRGALEALGRRDVEALGRGIDNWASVDGFCCFVAGPAWRLGRMSDRDVARWARSRDPWWRRAAAVSTVPLNLRSRGGTGDPPRTIAVLEHVAGDRHPMVTKAVSWALRVLVQHDRRAVLEFLRRHDSQLPALVKREVGNKLRTGRKHP